MQRALWIGWSMLTACGVASEPGDNTKDSDSGTVVAGPASTPSDDAAWSVCINELMASNDVAVAVGDGEYPDWLELHNPSDLSVSLAGWSLVDETTGQVAPLDTLGELEPGAFLVLYADGTSRGGAHLPWTLPREGGAVFLQRDDGGGDRIVYGELPTDWSAFRQSDCCASADPDCFAVGFGGTPGASNAEPYGG